MKKYISILLIMVGMILSSFTTEVEPLPAKTFACTGVPSWRIMSQVGRHQFSYNAKLDMQIQNLQTGSVALAPATVAVKIQSITIGVSVKVLKDGVVIGEIVGDQWSTVSFNVSSPDCTSGAYTYYPDIKFVSNSLIDKPILIKVSISGTGINLTESEEYYMIR